MSAIVFASGGSRKYHFDQKCKAFESAQMLNDWDCCCDDYCSHRSPRMHALVRMSSTKAAMDGKLPCLVCVPAHLRELPGTENFGHVGMDSPFDDGRYCIRCHYEVDFQTGDPDVNDGWETRLVSVPWPCTSALVLGIAPRPCPHCHGNQADPDDPGDWVPEVGMHNPYSAAPCPKCNGTGLAT